MQNETNMVVASTDDLLACYDVTWTPSIQIGCSILVVYVECVNYRLITACFCDQKMHARWDFNALNARTRRVSTFESIKIEGKVHYTCICHVTILDHKVARMHFFLYYCTPNNFRAS